MQKPHVVIISYSTEDSAVASRVAQLLEVNGLGTWIAPRDVTPGHDYAVQIIEAIETSRVMVLVLSKRSNSSVFVRNEVERAISKGKVVIPLRIQDVQPSRELELFVSRSQWVDAWTPPLETRIAILAGAIRALLGMPSVAPPPQAAPVESAPAPLRPEAARRLGTLVRPPRIAAMGAAFLVVAIALGGLLWFTGHPGKTDSGKASASHQASLGVSPAPDQTVDEGAIPVASNAAIVLPSVAISAANATAVATIGTWTQTSGVDVYWSADGKTIGVDTAIDLVLLDSATLAQSNHFAMSAGNGVTVSPDGKLIVSADSDGIQLWSSDGAQITGLIPGSKETSAVVVSPDGKTIASRTGSTVKLWSGTTGAELQTLISSDSGGSAGLAFSPDGKILAVGTQDGVEEWNAITWKRLSAQSCMAEPRGIAFSPDGKTMAVVGMDDGPELVKICNPVTGLQIRAFDFPEGQRLAFSPDGKILAGVGPFASTVELWDATSGKKLASLAGHTSDLRDVQFSPDGKILASVAGDGLRLWGVPAGPAPSIAGADATPVGVPSVSLSASAVTPANAVRLKQASLWDKANVDIAAYTPDGKTLLAFDGHTMHLLNPTTLDETGTISPQVEASRGALSRDGTRFALAGYDGASVWGLDGHRLASMGASDSHCAAFSPNQKLLVTCTGSAVKVWDAATGRELRTLPGDTSPMSDAAFTPDGRTLITASGSVAFWSTSTWQQTRKVSVQSIPMSLAVSPDGKTVAAGTFAGVTILDVATGATDGTLVSQDAWALAYSPDGRLLAASSGFSGTVIVWDVAGRRQACTLAGHSSSVATLAFSPDGATLATGGSDGTLRLWRVGS